MPYYSPSTAATDIGTRCDLTSYTAFNVYVRLQYSCSHVLNLYYAPKLKLDARYLYTVYYSAEQYMAAEARYYDLVLILLELDYRWASNKFGVTKNFVQNAGRNFVHNKCPYEHLEEYPPFFGLVSKLDWRNISLLDRWREEGCSGRSRDLLKTARALLGEHKCSSGCWEAVENDLMTGISRGSKNGGN